MSGEGREKGGWRMAERWRLSREGKEVEEEEEEGGGGEGEQGEWRASGPPL